MIYITGQHALNLPCLLATCGDWHISGLQWKRPFFRDSNESIFDEYGIESNRIIPEHIETYNVANHIRALLDLIELGKFSQAQGMNKDFICNDEYTEEVFGHVIKLKNFAHWNEVDSFMGKEYFSKWLDYKSTIGRGTI